MKKFHAFALAEQLNKHNMLERLFTSYAYQKNNKFRKFAKRVDKEIIPIEKISTNIPLAILIKAFPRDFAWNERHDLWVASELKKTTDYKIFIGWSSMCLHSIRAAKKSGKITIVERGSSHILYQNRILKEEYKKFGKAFSIHPQIIEKEIKEYEEADYISIPSTFVKNSFIEFGVPQNKLILNPYGVSSHFVKEDTIRPDHKFRILYLGSLTIQKGLIYLFKAIDQLNIAPDQFEVWIIGHVADEMRSTLEYYKKENWRVFGHVSHYELPNYLSQCDVAIQPSLQEGLSMVIPQLLACGVPVVATTNTGGEDIIVDGTSGYIVPIRSTDAISEKIEFLFSNPAVITTMKNNAAHTKENTWNDYGNRYTAYLKKLLSEHL